MGLRCLLALDAIDRLSRVRAGRARRPLGARGAAPHATRHRAVRQAPVDVVCARARDRMDRHREARRRRASSRRDRPAARTEPGPTVRRTANGTRNGQERAVIGALRRPTQHRSEVDESLEELAGLVVAAGGAVVGRVTQERTAPTPALYFGRGKVEEIGAAARAASADLFISDDELSPIQERNISEALGIKVIDRTALILDIFAQRARTAEGKLQVELAQLTYLMPRLRSEERRVGKECRSRWCQYSS